MRKFIFTAVLFGTLMLGETLGLAEEPATLGQENFRAEVQSEPNTPLPGFEQRLGLKPLSDEELDEITAAGVGPIAYMLPPWVYGSVLLQPHIPIRQPPGETLPTIVQTNHRIVGR